MLDTKSRRAYTVFDYRLLNSPIYKLNYNNDSNTCQLALKNIRKLCKSACIDNNFLFVFYPL